jgi:hypothetical protein
MYFAILTKAVKQYLPRGCVRRTGFSLSKEPSLIVRTVLRSEDHEEAVSTIGNPAYDKADESEVGVNLRSIATTFETLLIHERLIN